MIYEHFHAQYPAVLDKFRFYSIWGISVNFKDCGYRIILQAEMAWMWVDYMPSRRDFHRFPILYTLVGKIAPITKKGVEMELPQEGTHASSRSVLQCFHVRTCFSISIQCLDDSNSNAWSIPMRNLPINHRTNQPTTHPLHPQCLDFWRFPGAPVAGASKSNWRRNGKSLASWRSRSCMKLRPIMSTPD